MSEFEATAWRQLRAAGAGRLALVAAAFAAAALVTLPTSRLPGWGSNLWIADAIVLGLCLRAPRGELALLLAGAFVCGVAANAIAVGSPLAEALALGSVSVGQAILALMLIRGGSQAPLEFRADRTHYLQIQAVAAGIAPLAGAVAAGWFMSRFGRADALTAATSWWSGQALGALTLLPVALASTRPAWRRVLSGWRLAEFAGWLIGAGAIAYGAILISPYPFLIIAIPAVLVAFRGDTLTAAVTGAAIAGIVFVSGASELVPPSSALAELPVRQVTLMAAITAFVPFCISLALSELRRANARLAASESRWSFALQSAGQGVWDRDVTTGQSYFSPVWKAMLGYVPEDIGESVEDWRGLLHPDDRAVAAAADEACLSGRTDQFECEFRMRHKDGSWVWILDRGRVIERDPRGKALRMIGTHTDITKQKAATERLARLNQRIQLATKAGNIGIWELNIATGGLWWDGRMYTLFGTDPGSFANTGAAWARLVHTGDRDEFIAQMKAAPRAGGLEMELRTVSAMTGETRFVRCTAALLEATATADQVLVGTCWDVTQQRIQHQRIAPDPTHDPLTGLPNRRGFERAIAAADVEAAKGLHCDAVCVLDLYRFHQVNDASGPTIGDTVLRKVAGLLRQSVRGHDLVARIGGDEFGLLLRNTTAAQVERVCAKLVEAIADALPDSADGLGANIGVAMLGKGGYGAEEAFPLAERACTDARCAGRGHVRFADGVAGIGNAA